MVEYSFFGWLERISSTTEKSNSRFSNTRPSFLFRFSGRIPAGSPGKGNSAIQHNGRYYSTLRRKVQFRFYGSGNHAPAKAAKAMPVNSSSVTTVEKEMVVEMYSSLPSSSEKTGMAKDGGSINKSRIA